MWFGEQVVAGESRGFESGLLLVDQRLQTGTLRGDAGFCGHGPAAALKSPSAGSKQDVNPLFAQQFVMAAGRMNMAVPSSRIHRSSQSPSLPMWHSSYVV